MDRFGQLLLGPLEEFWKAVAAIVPGLLAMLIIIAGGIVVAWVARFILTRLFRLAKLDAFSERSGITSIVRKAGFLSSPSEITARTAFWVIVIIFSVVGLNALGIERVGEFVSRFFLYLPRAFSALFILVAGYIIAGFIGRAVLLASVNSGFHYAKLLAEAVRLLLIVLTLAMALEQLRIAPVIVMAAFSITFGGIVLALSIAFGVAGIETARKILGGPEEEGKKKKRDIDFL